MGFKYLGPAHNLRLEEGGKVYNPGDEVPITLNRAFHLSDRMNGGHLFEGLQEELDKATAPDVSTAGGDTMQMVADADPKHVDPDAQPQDPNVPKGRSRS